MKKTKFLDKIKKIEDTSETAETLKRFLKKEKKFQITISESALSCLDILKESHSSQYKDKAPRLRIKLLLYHWNKEKALNKFKKLYNSDETHPDIQYFRYKYDLCPQNISDQNWPEEKRKLLLAAAGADENGEIKQEASQKNPKAQYRLAKLAEVKNNNNLAWTWYEQTKITCENKNSLQTLFFKALYQQSPLELSLDPELGIRGNLSACLKGHAKTQALLGLLHYLGGIPSREDFIKEYDKIIFPHLKYEKQNIPGKNWQEDWSFHWIGQAAIQGNVGALFHLGWIYEQGFGVKESSEKAKEYYQAAADRGSVSAKRKLGENIPFSLKDQKKITFWKSKETLASILMKGYFYEAGYCIDQNENQALKYYGHVNESSGPRRLLKLKNCSLQRLDLHKSWIDTASVKELTKALLFNTSLQQLSLRDNQIGDAGAKELSEALLRNTSLQRLDLLGNWIGALGAKALSEALLRNTSLQQLSLRMNQIGDAGARALSEGLKGNASLQTLDLSYNTIGAEGARALSEALKENSSLQTLHLHRNNIGAEGARALSEGIKKNSSLQTLHLDYNKIGDALLKEINRLLERNRRQQKNVAKP